MNYYDHNIGDFASMTQGLDDAGVGICIRLLDRLMLTEEPIKTQWVYLAFQGESQKKAMAILEGLFQQVEDGWVYGPYLKIIDRYVANGLKNKENGKKGGRPKKTIQNPSGSSGFSTETQNNPMGFSGFSTETQTEPNAKATNNQEPITKIDSTPANEQPQEAKKTRKVEPKTVFLSCPSSDHLCEDWREQLCQRRPDLVPHAEAIFFDFKDYWTKGEGRSEKRTADGWRRTWLNNLKKARVPTIPYEKPAGTLPIPPEQQAKIDAERAAGKVYVPKPVIVPKPKTDKLWGVNEDLPDEPPFEPEDIPAQEHKPIDDGRPSWCPPAEICGDDDFSDGDDDDDRECRSDYHWEDRDPANLDAETEPIDPELEACFKANFKGLL